MTHFLLWQCCLELREYNCCKKDLLFNKVCSPSLSGWSREEPTRVTQERQSLANSHWQKTSGLQSASGLGKNGRKRWSVLRSCCWEFRSSLWTTPHGNNLNHLFRLHLFHFLKTAARTPFYHAARAMFRAGLVATPLAVCFSLPCGHHFHIMIWDLMPAGDAAP